MPDSAASPSPPQIDPARAKRRRLVFAAALIVIVGAALAAIRFWPNHGGPRIVYGISAYQDTVMPYYAESQGWYVRDGLNVELRVLDWGAVMPTLGNGVDVAIQNFNSFQASYENLRKRGLDPVFYYPLFVFKGAALVAPGTSTLPDVDALVQKGARREDAVKQVVQALRGKKIGITQSTEMEQLVLSAFLQSGMAAKDAVTLVPAQPADGLAALKAGSLDALSAGLTEQTAARRAGARVILRASDVIPPVIDGLVTTKKFADAHPAEMKQLVDAWLESVRHIEGDFPGRIRVLQDYLAKNGASSYSTEEYQLIWKESEYFPRTKDEVAATILGADGAYYWVRSWDANNDYLIKEGKISAPIPKSAAVFATP